MSSTRRAKTLASRRGACKTVIVILAVACAVLAGLVAWLLIDRAELKQHEQNSAAEIEPTTREGIFATVCNVVGCSADNGLAVIDEPRFGQYSTKTANFGADNDDNDQFGLIRKLGYEDWEMISVGIGNDYSGFSADLFRVSPQDDWILLHSGHTYPTCELFEPGLLRHAFKNMTCQSPLVKGDINHQTTVGDFYDFESRY